MLLIERMKGRVKGNCSLADQSIKKAKRVAEMITGKYGQGFITSSCHRPKPAILLQYFFNLFLLCFVTTALNQFHHHKAWQRDLLITQRTQSRYRRRVLAQKIDHNVGVEEEHFLSLTMLSLFTKLTSICHTVFDVVTIFPKPDKLGMK